MNSAGGGADRMLFPLLTCDGGIGLWDRDRDRAVMTSSAMPAPSGGNWESQSVLHHSVRQSKVVNKTIALLLYLCKTSLSGGGP